MRYPCLFLAVFLALAASVWASGSYVPRPPRQLAKADRSGAAIDPERYGVGRALVLRTGEIRLPTTANPKELPAQSERLKRVEDTLPGEVKSKAQLGALAGRLTEAQLEGVIYYLNIRFPAR